MNAWIISRYNDIREVLKDPVTFSSELASGPSSVTPLARRVSQCPEFSEDTRRQAERRLRLAQSPVLLNCDPPEHRRQRSLVAGAFTPRRIDEMEPHIQSIADALIDSFPDSGQIDLVADFALPLPMTVIASILGVPADMMHVFKQWTVAFTQGVGALDLSDTQIADMFAATNAFYDYFSAELDKRRADPRDDLLGTLMAARVAGERPLSDDELLQMLVQFLVAGNETTTNLISSMMYALLQDADQMRRLRSDPASIRLFIEECLRLESPTQGLFRTTTVDTVVAGTPMPRGSLLFLVYAAANRDDTVFADPDAYDLDTPRSQHLAFGRGEHTCLGANIARREAAIAVHTLLNRLADLTLTVPPESVPYNPSFILRGLATLPVKYTKAGATG